MSRFKCYRKLRGGYWVYITNLGWDKVCVEEYVNYGGFCNDTENWS